MFLYPYVFFNKLQIQNNAKFKLKYFAKDTVKRYKFISFFPELGIAKRGDKSTFASLNIKSDGKMDESIN